MPIADRLPRPSRRADRSRRYLVAALLLVAVLGFAHIAIST
jgi:hypothetical protein